MGVVACASALLESQMLHQSSEGGEADIRVRPSAEDRLQERPGYPTVDKCNRRECESHEGVERNHAFSPVKTTRNVTTSKSSMPGNSPAFSCMPPGENRPATARLSLAPVTEPTEAFKCCRNRVQLFLESRVHRN